MRTIEYGTTTHVPAFLTKLWKLVTDVSCDELISWSPAGTSFIIFDEIRFSKELLPMYFKHNNMASFVRQLNMYGFRKLSCIDQGGMHCYRSEIEFYHQYFIKGQESLLELIKRKIPSSKSDEPKVKQEYIDELMSSIKSLKGKQDLSEQHMRNLKKENRVLWRHVGSLTERYAKQQAVLHQLVPFIMNMIQSSTREVAIKRKAPLMIDEGNIQSKFARLSPPYYVEHNDQDQCASMPSSPGNVTNRGPVIHDVTEMESSKMYPANILCSPNTSTKESEAIVDSPLSCSLESSEQTIDSPPYTEPGSVETLNILNQNFERRNSMSPHMEMKRSPVTSPIHLDLPSHTISSPPASGSNFSVSSGIPPVTVIDETTSDVPLQSISLTSPSNLLRVPFVPKIEDTCTDSGMYTMDSMMNERTSMMPDRTTLTNKPNSISEGTSSAVHPSPSSSQDRYLPNSFQSSSKSTAPNMPWMLNQDQDGSEANIENWLGHIFKIDNLVPGLSLPQKLNP